MSQDISSTKTADDPTQAILSESALKDKYLCDYVINVATGCRHGCKFCYVPSTPNVRARPKMLKEKVDVDDVQEEWGSYVLYREGLGERLDNHLERKRTWKKTDKGCGIVGVSFSTDCYMDGRAGKITRNVVEALTRHEKYTRVLTRNPILALQDADVFRQANEYVTIGSSIPCLDAEKVKTIEPQAPPPTHRLRGLRELNEMGIRTYVSMSPTYPTQDRKDLREQLERIKKCEPEVVFHEPINPRGANFQMAVTAAQEAGESELASALNALRRTKQWVHYATSHLKTVQELGEKLDLPVHLWPDKRLIRETSGPVKNWLKAWLNRQSPESFADRNTPDSSHPPTPRSKEIPLN